MTILIQANAFLTNKKRYLKALKRGQTRRDPVQSIYSRCYIVEKKLVQPSKDLQSLVREERKKIYQYLCESYTLSIPLDDPKGQRAGDEIHGLHDRYLRIYVSATPIDPSRTVGNFKDKEGFILDLNKTLNLH